MNDEQADSLILRSQLARLDFLRTDLAWSKTFVDLAITEVEIGEFDAARQVLSRAQQGCKTIQRMVLSLDDPHQQNEILQRLGELRAAIDAAHQRLDVGESPPALR
jgi:hypothetical protein